MTEGMVWVVDDDRSIRFVLRKALERAGIPSRAFERAEDVLEALREERPACPAWTERVFSRK